MDRNLTDVTSLKHRLTVKNASLDGVEIICEIMSESFKPYKRHYTEEAYDVTVLTEEEVVRRLYDEGTEVMVAVFGDDVVGTVTATIKNRESCIRSMAICLRHQGEGVGCGMPEDVERRAKRCDCTSLRLESFKPLKSVVKLYEKFGFARTGKKRAYRGIEIIEMSKEIG